MKILFVDDSLDTRELYAMAFRLKGHEARLETNGLEAVAAVRSETFDVLVIDVEMPEMNGWDAVRAIRQLKHGAQLPIIMFTAYGASEGEVAEAGGDLLLQKPVMPDEMMEQIGTLIAQRNLKSHANQ